MMFAYSFLAMTSYNIIQPLTRSKLISSLGAVNIPYVIFGAGLFIGLLMLAYTRFYSSLPADGRSRSHRPRWPRHAHVLDIVPDQACLGRLGVGRLLRWGNLLGVLVISQFWTLANGIYDPGRQSGSSGSSGAASCSAA